MKNLNKAILILSAVALFSALGVASAEASTVTRSFDNPAPAPGSTLTVSLTVDVVTPDTFYLVDEIFPAGWVVSAAGTGDLGTVGHIKWLVLSGAVDTVLEYTLAVPANALGQANFSGEFAFDSNPTPVPILGTASVTVPGVPVSITVTPNPATVGTGNSRNFTAVVIDQAGNTIQPTITWTTSDSLLGTINASGVFTAVAPGSVTVTAAAGAVLGTANVSVQAPTLASISVSPAAPSVVAGGTQQLTVSGLDQFGSNMTVSPVWTSSNELVATVDASGRVSALAAGNAVITAAVGAVSGISNATVLAPVLTTINIVNPGANTIKTGTTRALTAQTLDQINNPISAAITWTSSNQAVGTVSASGVFTALAGGQTTITAGSGAINDILNLTVASPVLNTLNVTPASPVTVLINADQQFTASALDQFGDPIASTVTWTSSNPLFGSIDANGLFRGLVAGDVVVTAAAGALATPVNVTVSQFSATLNLTVPSQWALFSAPQGMAAVGITTADVDAVLMFDSLTQQFVQITDSASPELLNPLNAFLVRPNKATAINFTRANPAVPGPVTKRLNQGWNLISTNNLGLVGNELASLQVITSDNTGIGMTALFVPQTLNARKSLYSDWSVNGNQDLNTVPLSGLPAVSMSPYDGYWVNMRGSMDYSKIAL